MVDLTTTNYGWTKPTTGADIGTWGPIVNTNYDSQDTVVKAISVVANAALPLAGGTMTGALIGLNARFDCATGGAAPFVKFSRGAATRWTLSVDTATETGGNASSNLTLAALADDGTTTIFTPLTITRSTGLVTLGAGGAVTGNLAVSGTITGTYTIPAGTVTPAMLTTGHATWDATGNFTASGGAAGALATTTTNTSTGAGVIARYSLTTGTANSSAYFQLNDVSGAPTAQIVVGSAVSTLFTDVDTHVWRSRAGAEVMRIASTGAIGIGTTTPQRALEISGAGSGEMNITSRSGLADWRSWNLCVDGNSPAKTQFSLRILNDGASAVQLVAFSASGTTGVVNFPQGLTSNGTALVLATDGRLTGLPVNSQGGNYSVASSDYGGCVHFTSNATVTLPTAPVGTAYEVSCDAGVTVAFSYGGTLRTVPANSTGAHTLTGPGSAFLEQKKSSEIWARGEIV